MKKLILLVLIFVGVCSCDKEDTTPDVPVDTGSVFIDTVHSGVDSKVIIKNTTLNDYNLINHGVRLVYSNSIQVLASKSWVTDTMFISGGELILTPDDMGYPYDFPKKGTTGPTPIIQLKDSYNNYIVDSFEILH